ncbi:MAG: efflux RND transporter periplasmic adaptor subunit [Sedimentisphaerales bacterium]|nr:efflux RND transporter periplasmic adaptor subunit [Sedimentisphaerales bacterium]
MTKTKFWLVIIAVLALTFWFGYFHKKAPKPQEKKIVPVEVETVTAGPIEQTIELTGWIKASQVVDVASKVAGRVESLEVVDANGNKQSVEEGLIVKKGQLLAVIDHDVYLAQLAAAKAAVEASTVELNEAEREENRMLVLYKSGSATEQAKDKAVTAAQLAAAALNAAKANLELARVNLQESEVNSPIDGIVIAKHIDPGNMINPGNKIVTVADLTTVKVIAAVAEKYAGQIAVGTPAGLSVDAYPDRVFKSSVYSVYPALDEQTHTIQIEIRFDNEQKLLKPGMFAKVLLITNSKEDVVVIPKDVILGGKIDKPYVYVVENASEEKKAHKRIVKIGFVQADKCEIIEGIKPGETLVVNGMQYLADGIDVEVVNMKDIK